MHDLRVYAFPLGKRGKEFVVTQQKIEHRGKKQRIVHAIAQVLWMDAGESQETAESLVLAGQESQHFQGQSLCV